MDSIVPRWEWRTFGPLSHAAEAMVAPVLGAPRASREVYIVADDCDLNVKIRDGVLDVKQLQSATADGLEQWRPVLKAAFPDESERFLHEFIDGHPHVAIVEVTKRRAGGTFNGCRVEIADAAFNGALTRTLAVESEDLALLRAALQALGLAAAGNVSYVRAIKRFLAHASPPDSAGAKEAPRHDQGVSI